MNSRTMLTGLIAGRAAIGALLVAKPQSQVGTGWIGDDAKRDSVAVAFRAVGARDVALALEPPRAASFQNVLPGVVGFVGQEFGALVEVAIDIGPSRLAARVTRKAVDELGLVEGRPVYALVKAVSIDRHSVGFA